MVDYMYITFFVNFTGITYIFQISSNSFIIKKKKNGVSKPYIS